MSRHTASIGQRPRVAIAHDYLTQRGGAERVVLAMAQAFPQAPIYTTLYDPDGTFPEFRELQIVTSPLDRIPALRRDHRRALPLLAAASSALRVDAELVLASSSGWAHGFDSTGRTIVYCHTPARWLYLADQYLGDQGRLSPARLALQLLAPGLRRWDRRAARRADRYLANSTVVRERIQDTYGIDAELLFPPHSIALGGPQDAIGGLPGGHFLVVSRLLPYKNVESVIEAFRGLPTQRLLIVGDGPLRDRIAASLPGNVELRSGISDAELRWAYASSIALIAPSHEDFGLTVLEAAAWGKPALALRAGGYLDTVVEHRTGLFFDSPTPPSIHDAVETFAAANWDADRIREHAEDFSLGRFVRALQQIAAEELEAVER